MKSLIAFFLVACLCLSTIGCTVQPTQLVVALNAVADASSVAVVVTATLATMGKLDPTIASEVATYSTAVDAAVQTSLTEINSTDTNAQKIIVITAAFATAGVTGGALSSVTSPEVAAAINALASTIKIFLAQLSTPVVALAVSQHPTATIVLGKHDKTMVKKIVATCAATNVMAAKLIR